MEQLPQHIVDGLMFGSLYALIALGYTMVYGVLRLINFAHGDVFMVGAYAGLFAATAMGVTPASGPLMLIPIVLASAAACVALVLVMERVAYRPLRNAPRLTALITAIGVSLLLENGGQFVFTADPRVFPELIPAGPSRPFLVIGAALVLGFVLEVFIRRTRLGRGLRAVSQDRDAAVLMGISVDRAVSLTFALGAALAAAAAILYVSVNPRITPLMGLLVGIKAFVAAVIGGIGSLPGALLGGLLLGLSEELIAGYGASSYRDAIAFGLLIAILVFRPTGLLGRGLVEKV